MHIFCCRTKISVLFNLLCVWSFAKWWQNKKLKNSKRKSDARELKQPHHNKLQGFLFSLLETKTPRTLLLQKRWRPATTYLSGRTRSSTSCTRPWTAPTVSCRRLPTSAWRRWGMWWLCVQIVRKAWSSVCKMWSQWWYWVPNCLACIVIFVEIVYNDLIMVIKKVF